MDEMGFEPDQRVMNLLTGRFGTIVEVRHHRGECLVTKDEPVFGDNNEPMWIPAALLKPER